MVLLPMVHGIAPSVHLIRGCDLGELPRLYC